MIPKPVLFLIASLLIIYSCERKAFKRVHVKGRVLEYFTKSPLDCEVKLVTDNDFSGSSKSVMIGRDQTDENGYFEIKGKASKAESYYLFVYNDKEKHVSVSEGKTTDLGTFESGTHTFTCTLSLLSRSGKDIELSYDDQSYNQKTIKVRAGHDSTIVMTEKFRKDQYEERNKTWYISYYLSALFTTTTYTALGVSIDKSDNIKAEIEF